MGRIEPGKHSPWHAHLAMPIKNLTRKKHTTAQRLPNGFEISSTLAKR